MKTLLAAVDFSSATNLVIEQASRFAEKLEARLWILHVATDEAQPAVYDSLQYSDYSSDLLSMPGDVQLARDLSAEELKREHTELLAISSRLRSSGIDAHAILLKGDVPRLIVEKASQLEAEIIILGSHGHGMLHKALVGSVSESVIRHAPCSVLIVPATRAQS